MCDLHQPLIPPKASPSGLSLSDWVFGSKVSAWLDITATRPLAPSDLSPLSVSDSAAAADIPYSGAVLSSVFSKFRCECGLLIALSMSVAVLKFLALGVLYECNRLLDLEEQWSVGMVSLPSYACVLAALLGLEVTAVVLQQKVSVRIMSGLSSLLHTKLLRCISASEAQRILGLMQLDLPRVVMYVPAMSEVPETVMSILGMAAFLVWKWGKGCLAGFAVYALSFFACYLLEKYANEKLTGMIECAQKRIGLVSELISCVKGIKLNAWEGFFEQRVAQQRSIELGYQRGYLIRHCSVKAIELLSPVIASLSLLVVNSYFSESTVDVVEVYATLIAFGLMQTHIAILIHYIGYALQLVASARQIDVISIADVHATCRTAFESSGLISIQNASFSPSQATAPPLTNLNMSISPGEFVAIVGKTASGKSSLLRALIGEMKLVAGKAFVQGSVAFASANDTYIANASVRDNILFGRPFDQQKYAKTVRICALLHDFGTFIAGDKTEIGEKGGNLSGGQKARIALARAVYGDCEIYLLDDPLAGVDAEVSSQIFRDCFLAGLAGKTRVLVTHSRDFLQLVDKVVVMDCGSVVRVEAPRESSLSLSLDSDQPPSPDPDIPTQPSDSGRLIHSEETYTGCCSTVVYLTYWRHTGGVFISLLLLACFTLSITTDLCSWTALREFNHDPAVATFVRYAWMQSGGVGALMLTLWVCYAGCRKAAKGIHGEVVKRVVRAPVGGYFEVTPKGRVLNTLSKDLYGVDNVLPMEISGTLRMLNSLFTSFGLTFYLIPQGVICVPLIFLLIWHFGKTYISVSRELTRLSQVCRSLLLSVFTESLHGLTVLRCFHAESLRHRSLATALDALNQVQLASAVCHCWVKIRLQCIYSCFFVSLLATLLAWKSEFQKGDAALLFTNTIGLSAMMIGTVMMAASLTSVAVSLERVLSIAK